MKVFDAFLNRQSARLMHPRHAKLVAAALLVIALSLAGLSVIAFSPGALSALAGVVIKGSVYIRLTNAILAIVCAAFFLWPREGGRLVGRWNDCVGLAFFTFFVQYGCRSILLLAEPRLSPTAVEVAGFITNVVVYVCSFLNNLLFLAAARILLNKKNEAARDVRPPAWHAGLGEKLKYRRAMFRASLPGWRRPTWVLIGFLVGFVPLLDDTLPPYLLWARFPDAIFSTYCLCWFAYATGLSFSVRRCKALAYVGFVLVLAYGAAQLVYAANPLTAYFISEADAGKRSRAARSFLDSLKPEVDIATTPRPGGADDPEVRSGRLVGAAAAAEFVRREEGARELKAFFDGAIFAILFPMKYLLFLPAFFLYLLSITSVNDFRKALRRTTRTRQNYLSAKGVLGVIGDSMRADEVEVVIRVPGVKRRRGTDEEHVLTKTWRARSVRTRGRRRSIYPVDKDPRIASVMQKEGRVRVETNEVERRAAARSRSEVPLPETLVLIPIRFHGGVIGVLRVVFRGFGKYNEGTLEQLKFIAEHLAPSVQDFRTAAAINKLSRRLSRPQGGRPADGFEDAARMMVRALQDLLNSLGVGLIIECGFKSLRPIYPESGPYYEILKAQEVCYGKRKRPTPVSAAGGWVRVEQDQLPVRTEVGSPYKLGNLMLVIPDEKDEFNSPTLGDYYLTRRMISSIIAQSISNAARTSLLTVIQELNDALNVETLTFEDWFAGVEAKIKKAGLLWVAAREGAGEPLRGRPEHVGLINELDDAEREALFGNQIGCVPVRREESSTRHIIHLNLGKPGRSLLLGVARTQFGRELNFRSPWRVFLESLANSAGAALARIEDRRAAEEQRRRAEEERLRAAEDELVETVGIISAMLMHELVNMVQDQSYTVAELLELAGGDDRLPEENLIASLTSVKDSTAMMLELSRTWKEITRGDECCSCSVRQAAQRALRLFRFGLLKKEITVTAKIPTGAVARVPSNFVALAFASLIGNAIDAIKRKGRIEIVLRTDEEGEHILCDVIDDGLPIPEEFVPLLFRRGTTNKNEHSGWGLYLVSRLLKKYGGESFLSYSNDAATCFTLRLPASPD